MVPLTELSTKISVDKIIEEINSLEWDPAWSQVCIQGVSGIQDPLYGSRKGSHLSHNEKDFTSMLWDGLEYTYECLDILGMFRTRAIKLMPKSCLSWHRDPTKRIHIPLICNKDSFHIIEIDGKKEIYQMEGDGRVWLMDTTLYHTGINASLTQERIHLVGCVTY